MAAQREDAAARTPDVAEQQLQDGRRANDLRAVTLLRRAERVADRAGPLPSGVLGQNLSDLEKEGWRSTTYLLHHLGRVSRVVSLQDLEDAAWMLQRLIVVRPCRRVGPTGVVVGACLRIVSGEEATVVFGIDVLVAHDRPRVGGGTQVCVA